MSQPQTPHHESYPDAFHDNYSRTTFGFWLYLMSDFVLFGALFATYAVLSGSTFGGPSAKELFNPPFTLTQTLLLLFSSLTAGLAGASAHRRHKGRALTLFVLTFLFGTAFLVMGCMEFSHLLQAGHAWDKSAFLSAYFTVVGTFDVHVIFGLLWILVLLFPILRDNEIDPVSIRRLTCLRMFWQFLNIVWVFIFTFVYLMGFE